MAKRTKKIDKRSPGIARDSKKDMGPRRAYGKWGRCTARSKTNDDPDGRCRQPARNATGKCHYHGGCDGIGRPLTHGRYSKKLPKKLAPIYEATLNDPTLLDLRKQIAALDAIAQRCMERAQEKDVPQFRMQLRALMKAHDRAADDMERSMALDALRKLIDRGAAEDAALETMAQMIERVARRSEEVWKIKLRKEHVVNGGDLVVILARMVDLIQTHTEPRVAARLLNVIEREVITTIDDTPGGPEKGVSTNL